MYKSTIIVRLQKEFIHRYKDAPEEVPYLAEYHRHMAFIEVELEVFHDDRELEFIMIKNELEHHLDYDYISLRWVDKSCEMVAKEVIDWLKGRYGERNITVSVFEDNENGGRVQYTKDR
jgi:NAD+--asparagine ADP-ribosyltransferase